jgi:hypothetical protein
LWVALASGPILFLFEPFACFAFWAPSRELAFVWAGGSFGLPLGSLEEQEHISLGAAPRTLGNGNGRDELPAMGADAGGAKLPL